MVNALCPIESQLAEDKLKHLEMVVLLISNDIYMLVKTILCETLFCSTKVLGHVDRSTVATKKKLSVKPVSSKIAPYRAILLSLKNTCFKTFLHKSLSEKISLRLIISPVEADAEIAVCLVKALVYPSVHGLPKLYDLSVAVLPFEKHLLRSLK